MEFQKFPADSDTIERAESATPQSTTRQAERQRDKSPDVFVDIQSLENWANVSSEMYPAHLRHTHHPMPNARLDHDVDIIDTSMPPVALGLSLLEIYYARICNAPVLFCKALLFQDYLAGAIPGYLLKGLFANATLFLNPEKEEPTESMLAPELDALRMYRKHGLTWARTATDEAMCSLVANSSLAACQALEVLQIYWFAVGNSKAGDLCLALAHRFCAISGYGQHTIGTSVDAARSLNLELQRRCFWACWISVCVGAEPAAYLKSAWSEASMIPLPARIVPSLSGWEVTPTEAMNENWRTVLLDSGDDETITTVAAAGIKMVGIWAKIQLFARSCSKIPSKLRIDEMSTLSDRAKLTYEESITSSYRLALEKVGNSADMRALEFFDALYHISQMTLHSKIVPFFSGFAAEPSIPVEVFRNSAKTMLHHADLYAKLVGPYLDGTRDATCLPPLLAFGAFLAATVFLAVETFAERRDEYYERIEFEVKRRRIAALKATICLLDNLRQYWKPLQPPFDKLSAAVQASPHWDFWTRESDRRSIDKVRMRTERPDASEGKFSSNNSSTLAAFNTSVQGDHFQEGCNFGDEIFLHSGLQTEAVRDSVSEPYQPAAFQVSDNSGFEDPGTRTGTIPWLHINRADNEWWNLQLNEDDDKLDGLDWLNFSNSDTWTYLI
ncbi:uncharacterized protein A1O9_00116 [Exophiala aquamarina CBS 119918]|uniref:Transcription factor domain-containing protein n=1 Tax=Exophiala aquamarina CBS 119918 TaxID=1182545 RepID=A0A072PPV3_9EURO|nr:uncharacterized protein A1O9_00116 [Exophiala aquamarina CBS 119918]KEF62144.1 hypothetical protein A1O9_00116 [Exophiala aquamarina CBS 119918]